MRFLGPKNNMLTCFQKLREHCVCNGYFNPEIPMYICDNATCKVWLHDECLIDDVLTRTYKRLVEDDSNGVAKSKKGKATVKRYKGVFKAKISQDGDAPPKVTITDLRPSAPTKSWDEVCDFILTFRTFHRADPLRDNLEADDSF